MSAGAAFLGGARERLLPPAIPMRFFLAASLFHIAAWVMLWPAAPALADFTGGPGPLLAAIHLLTLGVLGATAMGALVQILPVLTATPPGRAGLERFSFWAFIPGVAILTAGMSTAHTPAMTLGGVLVAVGLAAFVIAAGRAALRPVGQGAVAAHIRAALGVLVAAAGLGLAILWGATPALAPLHMILASFGFFGLLLGGLSLVLVPMLALSPSLPARPGWLQLALILGALIAVPVQPWAALALGAGAALIHLWLMHRALRTSARPRPGPEFLLLGAGRLSLLAALAAAAAALAGEPAATPLFGFLTLAGWLLTSLVGILQRILPFLALMHASGHARLPALTGKPLLTLHAGLHLAALLAVSAGIIAGNVPLIQTGAALGGAGALAFAAFAGHVVQQLRRALARPYPIRRGKRVRR